MPEKVTWETTILYTDLFMKKNSFWKYKIMIKFAILKMYPLSPSMKKTQLLTVHRTDTVLIQVTVIKSICIPAELNTV